MGPCMCGDTQCGSCGPAQGNSRCPVCRKWADEGCENPAECEAKAEELAAAESAAESAHWDDVMAEAEKLDVLYAEAYAFDAAAAAGLPLDDEDWFDDPMDELRRAALDHKGRP